METNCKNCGAPVDLAANKCPYCETPYHNAQAAFSELILSADSITLRTVNNGVNYGVITPNEARKILGLPEL